MLPRGVAVAGTLTPPPHPPLPATLRYNGPVPSRVRVRVHAVAPRVHTAVVLIADWVNPRFDCSPPWRCKCPPRSCVCMWTQVPQVERRAGAAARVLRVGPLLGEGQDSERVPALPVGGGGEDGHGRLRSIGAPSW